MVGGDKKRRVSTLIPKEENDLLSLLLGALNSVSWSKTERH